MTKTHKLETFEELRRRLDWLSAYKEWEKIHEAGRAVFCPARYWNREEWTNLHLGALCDPRYPNHNLVPDRRDCWLTRTGGRLPISDVARSDAEAPTDPPTQKLLLLSFQIAYQEIKSEELASKFDEFKLRMEGKISEGFLVEPSEENLAKLKSMAQQVRLCRAKASRLKDERAPLLPKRMKPKSKQDLVMEQRLLDRRAELSRQIKNVEI
jgi:hypothetical protein